MFEFLFEQKNPLLKLFVVLLFLTLVISLVNINFEVKNFKLSQNINNLEEENSILRAKYLSDTSISKLDYKAEALQMSEVSSENCTKLSKTIQRSKLNALKKEANKFLNNKNLVAQANLEQYLSGF